MKATIQFIEKELSGLYPENEIKSFARLILEHLCGIDYTTMILKSDKILEPRFSKPVKEIVRRLKRQEPIQYILGETEFLDLNLKITPSVLIPRPETEELVQWIGESDISGSLCMLDIGTGSGCIALALKSNSRKLWFRHLIIRQKRLKPQEAMLKQTIYKSLFFRQIF